ncbi:Metallo-dependent phosphatase-like protein [Aspergillus pseudodeflectus]|uniref:Metallo-dependent phosphatase-like protein n=1 Tax=Aspergillus pseudodeflectus TaxID=176178 RepID=A0ABR4JFU7_9EURO
MATSKPPSKVFPVTTFISDLPTVLIPQPHQSSPSAEDNVSAAKRLVIIGDVHGMRQSLHALLTKLDFNKDNGDHLILTGDLINKGPDSAGVLDLAMKLGASAVRGNHDNAVLNADAEIRAKHAASPPGPVPASASASASASDIDTDAEVNAGKDIQLPEVGAPATKYSTALALSREQIEWLAALPLILRVRIPEGVSSSLGENLVVVHAGLVPGIPLEEQDAHAVMHMRSLTSASDDDNNTPKLTPGEKHTDEPWIAEWDRWQEKSLSKTTVVFGHDAKRRLQLGKYAIGLDSGCLYGGQLSALVIEVSADGTALEHSIVQVDCADEPVAPKGESKEEKEEKKTE